MALNRTSATFTPYRFDLNIYRGCEHKCQYCYAVYSHKYLEDADFFDNIYYKDGVVEALDRQLSTKPLQGKLIGIGTVCDSYQPLEKQLGLTRKCLEVIANHKNPIYISTKSPLIERDVDILYQLSCQVPVSVSVSITTLNEKLAKKLEPNVVSPKRRFETLKFLKESTKALVGVHLMPVIPFLTDDDENLEGIIKLAQEYHLDHVIMDPLNLYGETKKHFFAFIKQNFPQLEQDFKSLYSSSRSLNAYRMQLRHKLAKIKEKYGLKNKYIADFLPKTVKAKQISFFD